MRTAGLGSTPSAVIIFGASQEQMTSQQPLPAPHPHPAMSQMSFGLCRLEPEVDGSATLAEICSGTSNFLRDPRPYPDLVS